MGSLPWHAMEQSLEIAGTATVVVAVVGIPLAALLAQKASGWRTVAAAVVFMPIVLPPTVIGYVLVYVLGRHGFWGACTGGSLLFTQTGAILAASIVALPLLVLPARSAFAAQSREVFEDARMAGVTRWEMFIHIALPLAWPNLLAGLLLAFGRALGEFGATLMVLGTGGTTRTLPIQIYLDAGMEGNLAAAAPAVLALAIAGLLITYISTRRLLRVPGGR